MASNGDKFWGYGSDSALYGDFVPMFQTNVFEEGAGRAEYEARVAALPKYVAPEPLPPAKTFREEYPHYFIQENEKS